jgi:hypothetical protein
MSIDTRWRLLLPDRRRPAFAPTPPRGHRGEREACATGIRAWENEGGNLAPLPDALKARSVAVPA